jgi:cell division protein FtsB
MPKGDSQVICSVPNCPKAAETSGPKAGKVMDPKPRKFPVSALMVFAVAFSLAGYFTFAAVQGDFGLFRRMQIQAQERELVVELAQLETDVAIMQNKTRRLSDNYLDLDLLDERARKVLGLARGDELVIR